MDFCKIFPGRDISEKGWGSLMENPWPVPWNRISLGPKMAIAKVFSRGRVHGRGTAGGARKPSAGPARRPLAARNCLGQLP